MCSVIGFLVFAVGQAFLYSMPDAEPAEIAYVVMLHFVLPLGAFYSIINNIPLSRWVIAIYVVTLGGATIAGKGVLGELSSDMAYRNEIAVGSMVAVLLWLFVSPKMRYYYAVISGKQIPDDLASREAELQPKNWLGPKARAALAWFLDHMETVVLVGFIVLTIFAYVQT